METDEMDDEQDHDECEHMHSWSITARLAALQPEICAGAPPELASLIAEARGLHPLMVRSVHESDDGHEAQSPQPR